MFILFLVLLVMAAFAHAHVKKIEGTARHELVLIYLVAGYCGLIMVGVSVWGMIYPPGAANMVGTEAGNPFQDFFLVAYLGISVMASLSIWIRGSYLTANVISWSIYWFGATYIHLADYAATGRLDIHATLAIIGAHTLVPILMLFFWWRAGLNRWSR